MPRPFVLANGRFPDNGKLPWADGFRCSLPMDQERIYAHGRMGIMFPIFTTKGQPSGNLA